MNMSFQEILDTQTGDAPNPDVSASISPQDFVNLTPEVQNTILYSIIRDLNTRVRCVEKNDVLRQITFYRFRRNFGCRRCWSANCLGPSTCSSYLE